MKAPSSVKGCGGTGGLELRAVVPPAIPDGLFPPVDITVHSISTRHRSRRLAPMQGDSAMRGRVVHGIHRANVPVHQRSPALHIGSPRDALVPRCTRSTGIDGRHGYVMSGVGRPGRPIEAAQRPRLGRPQLPQAPVSDRCPHRPDGSHTMDSPIPTRRTGSPHSGSRIFRPLRPWRPILIGESPRVVNA